jgi:methionyl-tRNA synthetase
LTGQPETWHDWWNHPDAKAYYFIGKDNIPFHAVIWPAQLAGSGVQFNQIFEERDNLTLTLPYDVPANEFMNMEGQKISGSRNWAVWGLDFLERYDPDPLRYYLSVNMPESKDTDWDWQDFVQRNNNELLATWGNLSNRVLSFAFRNWEGKVPQPGELRPQDQEIIAVVEAGFASVGEHLEAVRLRAALTEAFRLAGEVNKYLDTVKPWFEIKTDKMAAATSIYTALKVVDSLKIILSPFLPFTSEKLHRFLGYDQPIFGEQFTQVLSDTLGEHKVLRYKTDGSSGKWAPSQLLPGQELREPAPLIKKLDEKTADEERARMG